MHCVGSHDPAGRALCMHCEGSRLNDMQMLSCCVLLKNGSRWRILMWTFNSSWIKFIWVLVIYKLTVRLSRSLIINVSKLNLENYQTIVNALIPVKILNKYGFGFNMSLVFCISKGWLAYRHTRLRKILLKW